MLVPFQLKVWLPCVMVPLQELTVKQDCELVPQVFPAVTQILRVVEVELKATVTVCVPFPLVIEALVDDTDQV